MYYTIYKTTNLINNKIYIGLHETNNLDDDYLGSGYFLLKAIKKYGKSNFYKQVLFVFDNRVDMINKEVELVDEEFVNRPDTYNAIKGGFGLNTLSKIKKRETIEKIRIANKERDSTISSKQRIETLLAQDANIFKIMGAKSAQTQRQNYLNGYTNPRQRKDVVFIYNAENIIMFTFELINIQSFCKENNLPERVIRKSLYNKTYRLYSLMPPRNTKYLQYKGWYAKFSSDDA